MDNLKKETITKTLRLEKPLIDKIQQLADKNQRDFTKQVRFMLWQYLELIERQ